MKSLPAELEGMHTMSSHKPGAALQLGAVPRKPQEDHSSCRPFGRLWEASALTPPFLKIRKGLCHSGLQQLPRYLGSHLGCWQEGSLRVAFSSSLDHTPCCLALDWDRSPQAGKAALQDSCNQLIRKQFTWCLPKRKNASM